MENRALLLTKLEEISRILLEKSQVINESGLLADMALFQFYYAKFLGNDGLADIGEEILVSSINNIGSNTYPTYCAGVAGVGWVIDHLSQEGFIEADNDELLSEFDTHLHRIMVSDMETGYYDFLHGAIGYGYYFLQRWKNTSSSVLKEVYQNNLMELVAYLDESSEKDGSHVKWISLRDINSDDQVFNFSLAHGIPSVINFLGRLYEIDFFKPKVEEMLRGGVDYILNFMSSDSDEISLFPNWIQSDGNVSGPSRLAWCYGDLGIGITLWSVSKCLSYDGLAEKAIEILKHTTHRLTPHENMIVDAGICHGSYGNAQIYHRMYIETGDKVFEDAAAFWINNGLSKAVHEDGYAGYKQFRTHDGVWENRLSLLDGITGIGLSIISYLSDFDAKWDERLMIS